MTIGLPRWVSGASTHIQSRCNSPLLAHASVEGSSSASDDPTNQAELRDRQGPMTLHSSDLNTRSRIHTGLPQVEDRPRAHAHAHAHELPSARARIAARSRRLGGRTGYVISGSAGLLIVLLAEVLG